MPRFSALVACLVALLASHGAVAASGTALGVDLDAQLQSGKQVRTLVVGTDIFIGDKVVTDDTGLVQIRFSDNTELVVGPRSSLLIQDYLLREDGSNGKFAIDALSGTFRFVTGKGAKDRYVISTPTGTIGVRGTAFDFNVKPDHTSLLLFHGVVYMCNGAGRCVTVDGRCDVGMFDTAQAQLLGNTDGFVGEQRDSMKGMFPWAVSESDLRSDFWINQARECLNRPPVNDGPRTILESNESQPPLQVD